MPFGMGPAGWMFWPRWRGSFYPPWQMSPWGAPPLSPEDEIKMLEEEAEMLEQQLKEVKKAIDELKRKKDKSK